MINDDERIALFLDYENLAIGARDGLGVAPFDFGPVADALAERGRVVARRAYADWSYFDEDRRLLARAQVELIEIPQRLGGSRKNAADIKMAVDAIELAYERGFITTFAIGTGDSDFTPLVHKLREMDKRVIGIGVQSSTSALLPPACDEFLFYDRLPGVEPVAAVARARRASQSGAGPGRPARSRSRRTAPTRRRPAGHHDARRARPPHRRSRARLAAQARGPAQGPHLRRGRPRLPRLRRAPAPPGGPRVVELRPGSAQGDPEVTFPEDDAADDDAFALLVDVVRQLGRPQLSRPEEPAAQARARVQREALRLQHLPLVRQGRPHPRPAGDGLGTTRSTTTACTSRAETVNRRVTRRSLRLGSPGSSGPRDE